MGTTRTFQAMLNEYMPNDLLKEELLKRDYILQTVEKDNNWKGGKLIVPFMGGQASSVQIGSLTASNDIAESSYIRGSVDDYIELWGSLIFNHRDLQEQNGKIIEGSFLKILPDEIEQFMSFVQMATSLQLGTGPHMAKVTASGSAASGIFTVDKIDRFVLGQKLTLDDDDSGETNVYIIAINVNNSTVTCSATRGGAAANLSAYTTAQNAKFYYVGAWVSGASATFTSMRTALLSLANGGSTTLHGQTKTSYPILQAINVDGSTITSSNILDSIFDAYSQIRQKARGNASKVLMSYAHLGAVMKLLEVQKGSYKVTPNGTKVSQYGWTEIEIISVKGALTLVGLQEWDNDIIVFWDPSSTKFYSNGFFKKRMSPDGKEYFEVRNTTGYQYVVDVSLFGEMVYAKPSSNGILYGIPTLT